MAQSENKCSMFQCLNTFNTPGKMFFNFPTDLNLCSKWIENCQREDFMEKFSFCGALPFLLKYVCEDHFVNGDIIEDQSYKGLREGAIPMAMDKNLKSISYPDKSMQQDFSQTDQENSSYEESKITIKFEPLEVESFNNRSLNKQAVGHNAVVKVQSENPSEILKANLKEQPGVKESLDSEWQEEQRRRILNKKARAMALKRQKETPEQRARRLERDKLRNRARREQERKLSLTDPEVEERLRINKMRQALLAAMKRQNESPEEKALRRERERMRVKEKRKKERELSKTDPKLANKLELKRLKYRVMVALKRQNEDPEKRERRLERERNRVRNRRRQMNELSKEDSQIDEQLRVKKLKERILRALQRQNETPEKRASRLEKMKLKRREERKSKKFYTDLLAINPCEVPFMDNGDSAVKRDDLEHGKIPLNPSSLLSVTLEQQSTNSVRLGNDKKDDVVIPTTSEELLLLQNRINEELSRQKNILNGDTNSRERSNNNHLLLDDRLHSDFEESSDGIESDSDYSEYERYLSTLDSDESQDRVEETEEAGELEL